MSATVPDWIQAIFTVIGACSLLFLAAEQKKRLSKLRFDFKGGHSSIDGRGGKLSLEKEGIIRNLSFNQDTISNVGIIILDKKKKCYSYFAVPRTIQVENLSESQTYKPPFNIPGRVAVRVQIKLKDWPIDQSFIRQFGKINPSFDVKFCFESIDGAFFNETGELLDIPSMHSSWILEKDRPNITSRRYWDLKWELAKTRFSFRKLKFKRFFGFL